ncbi:MAG: galactose oxidase early set domain-containing protein [Aquabacterium sp.]
MKHLPQSLSSIRPTWRPLAHAVLALAGLSALPAGAAVDTYVKGSFGPVVSWPLIPLHMVLLPDGRVMAYGTDGQGNQTGQFIYDVWNPAMGTGANAHMVLPNTTGTDTFCSGQLVLPSSGAVLLVGGDKTVNGVRNYSVNDVNLFDYRGTALYSAQQPMAFLRWYPTVLTTAAGEALVLGGRVDPNTPAPIPEVYTEGKGWRQLTTASSDDAYGINNWSYPRAWQAPNGKVFIVSVTGATFYLDPAGTGKVDQTGLKLTQGDIYLTSLMYAPGKILSFRKLNKAVTIDLNGATPTSKSVTGVGQDRYQGSATVMADGKVFVSGGSMVTNVANGVAYTAKIWDPANSGWTTAATATKMRLYHSVSMLLPDARVITAGGGAPGPVTNLNAEIYTPPYLYVQDRTATLATRPVIQAAPATATWAQPITVTTDVSGISKVTLVHTGSATHTLDFDQRFINLSYSGSKTTLSVTMPASANVAPPGYYMLFVFNSAGVPSVAKFIKLG